ncbi:hypothetical protein EZV62_012291 [Acer yangbiense]|uniref:Reverse transcriptase Ty1/copia-type domain-containing protein n=1 Tax=Acer yangbiense TaxID=1000413 RepID=A0A5C7HVW2_9ROSI|nr:hypothetical protein EZV62_012291 [Acer yangbiense]
MTIELANIGEKKKFSDENEAIILLNSLPESFKDVKAAIKYGRSSLSLEECVYALKSKELELKIERKDNGENLFVREQGIVRHRTVRHTPQQNGVAGRMNRTVLEKVRCLLIGAVTVEEDPIEDDRATHSDGMHQMGESQNQLKIIYSLADYELVRDMCRRIIKPNNLVGYVDSDYADDRDKRRSTSSYLFTIAGCCVCWKSQLQLVMALSATKAEYIAVTEAIKEAIWLQGLLGEINIFGGKVVIYTDSQSALH